MESKDQVGGVETGSKEWKKAAGKERKKAQKERKGRRPTLFDCCRKSSKQDYDLQTELEPSSWKKGKDGKQIRTQIVDSAGNTDINKSHDPSCQKFQVISRVDGDKYEISGEAEDGPFVEQVRSANQ